METSLTWYCSKWFGYRKKCTIVFNFVEVGHCNKKVHIYPRSRLRCRNSYAKRCYYSTKNQIWFLAWIITHLSSISLLILAIIFPTVMKSIRKSLRNLSDRLKRGDRNSLWKQQYLWQQSSDSVLFCIWRQ